MHEAETTVSYEERELGIRIESAGATPTFSLDATGEEELRLPARLVGAGGRPVGEPVFEGGPGTASFSLPLAASGGTTNSRKHVRGDLSLGSLLLAAGLMFVLRRRRR